MKTDIWSRIDITYKGVEYQFFPKGAPPLAIASPGSCYKKVFGVWYFASEEEQTEVLLYLQRKKRKDKIKKILCSV